MTYRQNVEALAPKIWWKEANPNAGEYTGVTYSRNGFGTLGDANQAGGIIDNCIALVSQKYLQVQGTGQSLFDDRTFSIELWHKHNPIATSGNSVQLFTVGGGFDVSDFLQLYYDEDGYGTTSRKYTFRWDGGQSYPTQSVVSNAVVQNDWHHIVVTFTPSAVKLYVDGTLNATVNSPNIPNSFTFDGRNPLFYIGGGSVFNYYMDEIAIYGQELTSTQIFNNYDSMYNAGYLAQVTTASALLPMPVVSAIRSPNIAADPATASALATNTQVSNFNMPSMLKTYLASLSLEQWFEFDSNIIKNSGSGGDYQATAFGRTGTVVDQIGNGPVGGNSLELGATNALGSMFSNSSASPMLYTTEMSDNDFSYGIWFKFPTSLGTNTKTIVAWSGSSNAQTGIEIRAKKAYFYLNTSSNTYSYTGTADLNDNAWHFAVVRHDGTNYAFYLDGSSVASGTTTGSRSTPTSWSLASGGTAGDTYRFNVADFFVAPYATVQGTQITNIWNAGRVPVQAGAGMVDPIVRFNNAFNDYSETLTPTASFRFNSSGAPVNYGTEPDKWGMDIYGTNYTTGHPTKNNFAYRVLNKDTGFSGGYQMSTNQFSDNQLSLSVYGNFGTVTGSDNQIFALMGAFSSANIWINGASSGPQVIFGAAGGGANWRIINSNDTSLFGGYHLYTATRSGSTGKFYVDGKLIGTSTTLLGTFTDTNSYTIGGYETAYLGAGSASVNKYIDEAMIFDYALSDQQVLELFQSLTIDAGTGSGLLPMPAVSPGFGPTINPGVASATGLLVDPSQQDTIAPTIAAMTATGLFQVPNFAATKNTDNASAPMTASANGENPVITAGANKGALHMVATASFPEAKARIPGVWNADPFTIAAEMVQPGLATTLGALIKAQSLNATAQLPLPPAYFTISDDRWYQRLLLVDYQSNNFNGNTAFFNTSTDIVRGGGLSGWNATDQRNVFNDYYGYNLTDSPIPVAYAGTYDPQNRKAVRIRNIALVVADGFANTGTNWTFETYIKTNKKNQILFVGKLRGDRSNPNYQDFNATWRLRDGKITLNDSKSLRSGFPNSTDSAAFTGFKDIADGEWHHIIIQNRNSDRRTQVFIDGELDIQRYGYSAYPIHQVGFNSSDANAYSDFETSAISLNQGSFVLERETHLNYYAATGIVPIEVQAASASATLTTGTRGKGNRAKALMLYFWPTFNSDSNYYVGSITNPFSPVGVNSSSGHDIGAELYDYDTFYGLSTYLKDTPEKFFDWDVFPLPIKNFYSGDTYRGDKHPLLNDSVTIKSGTAQGTTYVDPITDNYRYVNLMEDVYELDQYDAIFFRNYPDQSNEQDGMGLNSKTEVDDYFDLQEKTLFNDFLNNLREAIDTYNINLFVTNPQLAKDLGIIANASEVPLLRDQGSFYTDEYSDNRAPVVTGRVNVDGTPTDPVNQKGAGWYDTWLNDRHRVINTLEYLTDDNTFIWTDYAFYQNADDFVYGGPDRLYKRYENRPYGLQIDDEFVFADSGNPKNRAPYQAVKPSDLLAGIPITALSKKIWNQNFDSYVQVDNPYKDYITTIAVPIGTNLKGKLTKSKIFVSFSENVGNNFTYENGPQFDTAFVEYHQYDMASKYWVEIAYNAGLIDTATRAQYLAGTTGVQPPLYDDNNAIKQYWSLSGDNVISRVEPVTQNLKGFIGGDIANILVTNPTKTRTRTGLNGLSNSTRLRDALGRFASGGGSSSITGGNLSTFRVVMGRVYDTGTVFIPSINTRGLWWISEKIIVPGTVVGIIAATANGTLPQPTVVADHPASVNASSMIAVAQLNETLVKGPSRTILTLPMYATATIVGLGGKNVLAGTGANASATIVPGFAITQGADQVIMYLHHVNPIVYLRKEIIR
jgi:hypothetical protein